MKEVEFCPKESKVEPVVFSDALRTQALVVLVEIIGNPGTKFKRMEKIGKLSINGMLITYHMDNQFLSIIYKWKIVHCLVAG